MNVALAVMLAGVPALLMATVLVVLLGGSRHACECAAAWPTIGVHTRRGLEMRCENCGGRK